MRQLVFSLLFIFLLSCSSQVTSLDENGSRVPSSIGAYEYANEKLLAAGADSSFLEFVQENYLDSERARVLELNILGFLRAQRQQVDEKIPKRELNRVKKFLRKHKKAFVAVEKKYKVPKEVIASLLWVETKYGRDIGTFHTASVFYSLVQADYPPILETTIESAKQKAEGVDILVVNKIRERSKAKSEWAIGEFIALQEIYKQKMKDIKKLKGSFAGAFGMAQFLPSSYLTWAKSQKKKKNPNLFHSEDSIFSVANYLHSNGWEKKDRDAQEAALFHYNRDRDYVDRILRMSDCLKPSSKRIPSSAKKGSSSGC